MDEDDERDILTESNLLWTQVADMFRRGEFSCNIIAYEMPTMDYDQSGSEIYFFSRSYRPEIVYNGFNNTSEFRIVLEKLVSVFKTSFLQVVDDYTLSTGRRLNFFLEKREDIRRIIKDCYFISIDKKFLDRKYKVLEQDRDYQILQNEYLDHQVAIDKILQEFAEIQYEVLIDLEVILRDTLGFLPGRMVETSEERSTQKLNFNLKKSEVVLLLMGLRDSGHITGTTPASLAKFAEENFLYKYKPMKLVHSEIIEFRSGDVSSKSSWKSLTEKLHKLRLNLKE